MSAALFAGVCTAALWAVVDFVNDLRTGRIVTKAHAIEWTIRAAIIAITVKIFWQDWMYDVNNLLW